MTLPYLFSSLNINWILMFKLKTTKFIDAKSLKGPESMQQTNLDIISTKEKETNIQLTECLNMRKRFLVYIWIILTTQKSGDCLPSNKRNTRNPAEDNWSIFRIDIVASKYNKNSHKRGAHCHGCFSCWNHSSNSKTHCRRSKRFHSDYTTEFPKSRMSNFLVSNIWD